MRENEKGFLLSEWLVAIFLTSVLLLALLPILRNVLRIGSEAVADIAVADESRFIISTVTAYVRTGKPLSSSESRKIYAFKRRDGLKQAIYTDGSMLYLQLSDYQKQPITKFGNGSLASPRWFAGDDSNLLFRISGKGYARMSYYWVYGNRRFETETAFYPLPSFYQIGENYEFRK